MKVRSPYERERQSFQTTGESLTKQAMKDECDINHIMKKWEKTGVIDHNNTYQGQYGDFTEVPTYQEAMNKVIQAEEMFMSLPSKIRKRFDNDPGQFIEAVNNPENHDEMVELGLIKDPGENKEVEVVEKQPKVETEKLEKSPKGDNKDEKSGN